MQQDAEPLIWAVSTRSIGRRFDLDTSMVTVARPVSIELTPARAVSVTVEACAGDLYETAVPSAITYREERYFYMAERTGKALIQDG